MIKKNKIIILLGPTASGKSDIVTRLLKKNDNIQVINSDSKQIYKEIPIITAQPSAEEVSLYNYKLYGHVSINHHYGITDWIDDALKEINSAVLNDKTPLLIGGTGFYIKGLIEGLDELPKISEETKLKVEEMIEEITIENFYNYLCSIDERVRTKIQPTDRYRITKAGNVFFETGKSIFDFYQKKVSKLANFDIITTVILPPREILYSKIDLRFDNMIQNNLLKEVLEVHRSGLDRNLPSYKSHGLPELLDYFDSILPLEEAIEIAKKNTRNYAKRQITWFKHQLENTLFFDNHDAIYEFLKNQ